MSDSKRTGSRDISDLKARLGLKKGAAAPATGQTRANGGQTGGVVPPPGMNLPPPPGMASPQTAPQPVMPNASDDPFGAMNAMAAHHAPTRAPEIVIVNDGKPVENVGAAGHGAMIAKIVVPAALMLAIGVGVGRISKDANFYNDGLKGAKAILGDGSAPSTVSSLKKQLSALDNLLEESKGKGYKPDPAIDKQLSDLAGKLEAKSELVFRAKQNSLDAELAGKILGFYAGVAEVKSMIDNHVLSAKFDDVMFKKGKEAQDAATLKETDVAALAGKLKYAVVVQAPTETDKVEFGAKLVEIAGVYCGGSKNPVARCAEGESPTGLAYRNEPGGTPIVGDLASTSSDSVPTRKLLTLLPNQVSDSVIKGGEPGVSEVYYGKRAKALHERTKKLIEDANKLETALQKEASKGSRFSFFL